jgi:uncharacterized peroxidase-related enzyme
MTEFRIQNPETATAGIQTSYKDLVAQIGFVPNVFAVFGTNGPALEAFTSMNAMLGASGLSALEREIVQTAVSVANDCRYCVAGHTAFADMQGLDENPINAVRQGRPIGDPRHETFRQFAEHLIANRGRSAQDKLRAFIEAGYSHDQVFDVVLCVATKMFSNLISNITEIPLDDAFEPYAWKPNTGVRGAA